MPTSTLPEAVAMLMERHPQWAFTALPATEPDEVDAYMAYRDLTPAQRSLGARDTLMHTDPETLSEWVRSADMIRAGYDHVTADLHPAPFVFTRTGAEVIRKLEQLLSRH